MALLLRLLGLLGRVGWSPEGPLVDSVGAGSSGRRRRRLGHLQLQRLQGSQAVDLGLVLRPLLPSTTRSFSDQGNDWSNDNDHDTMTMTQ